MSSNGVLVSSPNSPCLRLPPELRLLIYEEIFRVECWEKHQALETANALKTSRSIQCPVCRELRKDGGYLYPPCRLISTEQGYYITGPCVRITRSNQRIHRTAILRTCRLVYNEAVDVLYEQTPLVVLLASKHHFSPTCKPKPVPRLEGNFTTLESAFFLRRIRNIYLRIVIYHSKEFEAMRDATRELFAHISADRLTGRNAVEVTKCRFESCTKCKGDPTNWHAPEALVGNAAFRCRFWMVDQADCADNREQHCQELIDVIKGIF